MEEYKGLSIENLLLDQFQNTDLYFLSVYPNTLTIVKDPERSQQKREALKEAIKKGTEVKELVFGDENTREKSVTISGTVYDVDDNTKLPYVNIIINGSQGGTTSNEDGYYALDLPPGEYIISFNYLDYEDQVKVIGLYRDTEFDVKLAKSSLMLDEVVVSGNVSQDLSSGRIGETYLVMKNLEKLPAFLGEPDVIKQVQSLPGVNTVGEVAQGFNVRGGSVDQNLILYDGIPIINSSHVFGFLSAFNNESIGSVTFYKGGIPAEYGGRSSSVLSMESKEGNFNEWKGNAGISFVAGDIMLEGPLAKNKTSLNASFRSTYSNWLINSIRTEYADLRNSYVQFLDGNVSITHKMENDSRLKVSSYGSTDAFQLIGDTTYSWHNYMFSGQYDHQFSPRLGSKTTVGFSRYGYSLENEEESTASKLNFGLNTFISSFRFTYDLSRHFLSFGTQINYYQFQPGRLEPASEISNVRSFALENQHAVEFALYVSDEWQFSDRFTIEAGVRVPAFLSVGPSETLEYEKGVPKSPVSILDTVSYGKFHPAATYVQLEPRLAANWKVGRTQSIKFGYNRIYQFIHLISNTAAVTPIDIWQPSSTHFKPQRADQWSMGYFNDFQEMKYGFSVEGFYKNFNNILDFKDGAQLILNETLEQDLLQGVGYSFGLEASFYKNTGRITGNLNYTYSRAFRKFEGRNSFESINEGKVYPANFDQPHVIDLSWKLDLSRRYAITSNFTYQTGRPITVPLSTIILENTTVAYFSERNQYRIPDYHRLDLALIIEGNHKRNTLWKGTWIFSVYNVYGRRNPYSVFFRDGENGIPVPYQLSIIGTVFPSVSYNIEF